MAMHASSHSQYSHHQHQHHHVAPHQQQHRPQPHTPQQRPQPPYQPETPGTPTIRQLLQSRSQHSQALLPAAGVSNPNSRDSSYSDVSSNAPTEHWVNYSDLRGSSEDRRLNEQREFQGDKEQEEEGVDTPSLYSRGELSPPLQYSSAFNYFSGPRTHAQGRMPVSVQRPDTATTTSSEMSISSGRSGESVYSPSRALGRLLPVAAEPQPEYVVQRERVALPAVAERKGYGGATISHSGSGWFEEDTEEEEDEDDLQDADGEDDEDDEDDDEEERGSRASATVTVRAEKVQLLPHTPIAVTFPTSASASGPSGVGLRKVSPAQQQQREKTLPTSPPRPSPTRANAAPISPTPISTTARPTDHPSPSTSTLASPALSQASPNLSANATFSAPLKSHLSYTGPKMTFLSPAPWEEEDNVSSSGQGGGEGRSRKVSEDRSTVQTHSSSSGTTTAAPNTAQQGVAGGKSKLKQLAGGIGIGRKDPSLSRESDRSELKGLGLVGPSPGKGQTTSSGSASSAGNVQGQRKASRERPSSPILVPLPGLGVPSPLPPQPPTPSTASAPAAGGKKGVGHKFSLPRLRHAFQAQPATGNKPPLPLPSPSTASLTSSLPSPSPLETDFPKTPTSASATSLSLHPYSAAQAQSPRGKVSTERERERARSEEKRSATMPEQGGAGITLISLEQARALAVHREQQGRQQSLPTPKLGSQDNLASTAQGQPQGQGQVKDKVLKGKRSFLRIFNSASPNLPSAGFARESKETSREEDVPPVPALPAAYLALPSPAMTASSGSSPQNSPPQASSVGQGQSLRERRQAARPSPPLEVNVLISRATNSDPSIAALAGNGNGNGSLSATDKPGPIASAPPGQSQFLSGPSSNTAGGLDVPRTPRTPAPPPLTLRPVSTAFSAGFANLLGEQLQRSPPKRVLRHVDEEDEDSPSQRFPRSAPASTTTSPVLRSSPARSAGQKQQSADEVIASLQAQIASSKRAWARRVEELESEVDGLKREVGRLEGLVRNESHVCDRCGGSL